MPRPDWQEDDGTWAEDWDWDYWEGHWREESDTPRTVEGGIAAGTPVEAAAVEGGVVPGTPAEAASVTRPAHRNDKPMTDPPEFDKRIKDTEKKRIGSLALFRQYFNTIAARFRHNSDTIPTLFRQHSDTIPTLFRHDSDIIPTRF